MATSTWIEDTLTHHNRYREIHLAPPLEWSKECYDAAKLQADACAAKGSLERGLNGVHGQNLFKSDVSDGPEDAVESWYAEHEKYDFSRPGVGEGLQFTQLIWAGTTHVGLASSDDKQFIVANYWPAGNEADAFDKNVLMPVKMERAAELVAGSEVDKIGLHFSTLPPNPIVVKKVTPGSWAAEMGVEVGDIIMEVNHTHVTAMTAEMFRQFLAERPVMLKLPDAQQQAATVKIQSVFRMLQVIKRADLRKVGVTTREELIKAVFALLDKSQDDSLSESEMLTFVRLFDLVSDDDELLDLYAELCSAYGWNPSKGLDLKKFSELVNDTSDDWYRNDIQLAHMHERLTFEVSLKPRPGRRGDIGRGYPEISCDIAVKTGMKLSMPPYPLEVREVTPGTWAHQKGVEVGDTFMEVNGMPVAGMTAQELSQCMLHRPLRLRIAEEREHKAALKVQSLLRGKAARKLVSNLRVTLERREDLLRQVFEATDQNKDGFLDARELLNMVRRMDFSGTDEEWFKVYPVLCTEYDWDEVEGLDIEDFAQLVNDKQDDWYCTNEQLQLVLDSQVTFIAALKIQRMVRGKRARKKVEAMKGDRKLQAAAVKIQSRVRGNQARDVTTVLRETMEAKKREADRAKRRQDAATHIQKVQRGKRERQNFNAKCEAILQRQRLQEREEQRGELSRQIFQVLDVNGDDKLSAGEMFPLILHLGLLDSEKEWEQAFPMVGLQYGWIASVGLDAEQFRKLISNQEDSYYCADDELVAALSSLQSRSAATKIQSTFRGHKTRNEVQQTKTRQLLELQELQAQKARNAASVKLQAAQRGKVARQTYANLQGAERLKKEQRVALCKEIFDILDSNRDGQLQRRELFFLGRSLDLIDEEEEWNVVFPVLCKDYGWEAGCVDYRSFFQLIDTQSEKNLYYCTNEQLNAVRIFLQKHEGATRVQRVHRGNMARREVAVRRASLDHMRKAEFRRQELAATHIQKVQRGRVARQQCGSMQGAAVQPAESSGEEDSDSFDDDEVGIDFDKDTELRQQEEHREREWAAMTIQSAHRSSLTRKEKAALRIQSAQRGKHARQEVSAKREAKAQEYQDRECAALRIQSAERARNARKEVATKREANEKEYQEQTAAALRIQSAEHGRRARREVAELRDERARHREEEQQQQQAAIRIQSAERARIANQEVGRLRDQKARDAERELAATRIQSVERARIANQEVSRLRDQKARDAERELAATRIQSAERARIANQEVSRLRDQKGRNAQRELAATRIQSAERARIANQEVSRLRDQKARNAERELAATRIQSAERARVANQEVGKLRHQKARDAERELAATRIQSVERARVANQEVGRLRADRARDVEQAATHIQSPSEKARIANREISRQQHESEGNTDRERAATRIQSAERARIANREVARLWGEREHEVAATRIQSAEQNTSSLEKRELGGIGMQSTPSEKALGSLQHDREWAAVRIQSAERARIASREVAKFREGKLKQLEQRAHAATRIQSAERARVATKEVANKQKQRAQDLEQRELAAIRIQSAARARNAREEVVVLKQERALVTERQKLLGAVFQVYDSDKNGCLSEVEALCLARCLGFPGSRDEWSLVYSDLCVNYGFMEEYGIDLQLLEDLTGNAEDPTWYCTNQQLRVAVEDRAAIKVQKVLRGKAVRDLKVQEQQLQEEEEHRKNLVALVFQTLDLDGDGALNAREFFLYARCFDFPGDLDEWTGIFPELAMGYEWDAAGVDLEAFNELVDDEEDTWYASNDTLEEVLEQLEYEIAAVRIQKTHRRHQETRKRAGLASKEAAALRIQTAERARLARKDVTKLRGARHGDIDVLSEPGMKDPSGERYDQKTSKATAGNQPPKGNETKSQLHKRDQEPKPPAGLVTPPQRISWRGSNVGLENQPEVPYVSVAPSEPPRKPWRGGKQDSAPKSTLRMQQAPPSAAPTNWSPPRNPGGIPVQSGPDLRTGEHSHIVPLPGASQESLPLQRKPWRRGSNLVKSSKVSPQQDMKSQEHQERRPISISTSASQVPFEQTAVPVSEQGGVAHQQAPQALRHSDAESALQTQDQRKVNAPSSGVPPATSQVGTKAHRVDAASGWQAHQPSSTGSSQHGRKIWRSTEPETPTQRQDELKTMGTVSPIQPQVANANNASIPSTGVPPSPQGNRQDVAAGLPAQPPTVPGNHQGRVAWRPLTAHSPTRQPQDRVPLQASSDRANLEPFGVPPVPQQVGMKGSQLDVARGLPAHAMPVPKDKKEVVSSKRSGGASPALITQQTAALDTTECIGSTPPAVPPSVTHNQRGRVLWRGGNSSAPNSGVPSSPPQGFATEGQSRVTWRPSMSADSRRQPNASRTPESSLSTQSSLQATAKAQLQPQPQPQLQRPQPQLQQPQPQMRQPQSQPQQQQQQPQPEPQQAAATEADDPRRSARSKSPEQKRHEPKPSLTSLPAASPLTQIAPTSSQQRVSYRRPRSESPKRTDEFQPLQRVQWRRPRSKSPTRVQASNASKSALPSLKRPELPVAGGAPQQQLMSESSTAFIDGSMPLPIASILAGRQTQRVMWRRSMSASPEGGRSEPEPPATPRAAPSKQHLEPVEKGPTPALDESKLPAHSSPQPSTSQARPSRLMWRLSRSASPARGVQEPSHHAHVSATKVSTQQFANTAPAEESPQRLNWRQSRSRSPAGVQSELIVPVPVSLAHQTAQSTQQDPRQRITWRGSRSQSPGQPLWSTPNYVDPQTTIQMVPVSTSVAAVATQDCPKGMLVDGVPSVKDVGTKRAKADDAKVEAHNPKAVGTKRGLM